MKDGPGNDMGRVDGKQKLGKQRLWKETGKTHGEYRGRGQGDGMSGGGLE